MNMFIRLLQLVLFLLFSLAAISVSAVDWPEHPLSRDECERAKAQETAYTDSVKSRSSQCHKNVLNNIPQSRWGRNTISFKCPDGSREWGGFWDHCGAELREECKILSKIEIGENYRVCLSRLKQNEEAVEEAWGEFIDSALPEDINRVREEWGRFRGRIRQLEQLAENVRNGDRRAVANQIATEYARRYANPLAQDSLRRVISVQDNVLALLDDAKSQMKDLGYTSNGTLFHHSRNSTGSARGFSNADEFAVKFGMLSAEANLENRIQERAEQARLERERAAMRARERELEAQRVAERQQERARVRNTYPKTVPSDCDAYGGIYMYCSRDYGKCKFTGNEPGSLYDYGCLNPIYPTYKWSHEKYHEWEKLKNETFNLK